MRDLHQDSSTIARARIASACAAMRQVVEYLQAFDDDVVRALALDVDDEANAARVVLVSGIVEALLFRNASIIMHHDTRLESGGADFAEA